MSAFKLPIDHGEHVYIVEGNLVPAERAVRDPDSPFFGPGHEAHVEDLRVWVVAPEGLVELEPGEELAEALEAEAMAELAAVDN